MFVTFEGLEGCGKTTQCKLLKQRLVDLGKAVVLTREPGGTEIGNEIRSLFKRGRGEVVTPTTELFLINASRAQLVRTVIDPALAQGKVVICDRFTDSTIAYQAFGRGLSTDVVDVANEIATDGLVPNVTFYLSLTVQESLKRVGRRGVPEDRMEAEEIDFFHRVFAGFEIIASDKERVVTIDATLGIDIISYIVFRTIRERLSV